MKKVVLLFIAALSMSISQGQEISDALRYAMDEIQGTARFRAMGGAFGALGGDMSAVSINPAGSAIFNNSHASISLGLQNNDHSISYFNGLTSATNSSIDLNQTGAAFVFQNVNNNSPWKKFVLGIAYDRVVDFDDDWIASGVNPTNTIGNYFEAYANGLRLDEISALPGETIADAYADIGAVFGFGHQQAFLGFESFILDPEVDSDENTNYINNITGDNYNQRYSYAALGYNGKLAFNLATQYDDKIHLGINLNSHFINYERSTFLRETNSNTGSLINNVGFENNILTTGSGFSFQLGTIVKLTKEFRVGLAYNSPTWYRLSEESSQYLEATRNEAGSNITQVINPNIINIFPEYKLQTPGKLTGSLAYIFGNKGLLSFDYSRKDYSETEFRPTSDAFFSFQNNEINNLLGVSNTYRLGAEYRHKQISLRGGYRFEESPYIDNTAFGDLTGYSLGIGYKFGNTTLDIAFSQAERDIDFQFYSVGLTDAAQLQSQITDVTLTLAFSL